MRVLGIIPARAGSRRLRGKNTLLLLGKPLVCHVIEAALGACRISRLVVSTDDEHVISLARKYGHVTVIRRPPELASDTSQAIEYVRHSLSVCEGQYGDSYDAIAIIQPTSPLTEPEDIDGTIGLLDESGSESAVSVVQLDHAIHPAKLKTMEGNVLRSYLEDERGRMASHELPPIYVRNGAIYVTRRKVLEQGVLLGADCRGYLMPRMRSVDINDELDYKFACFLACVTEGDERKQRKAGN